MSTQQLKMYKEVELDRYQKRNIEMWLCFDHLCKQRYRTDYIFAILSDAFSLSNNLHLYRIMGKRKDEEHLLQHFDPEKGSIPFQVIMRDDYKKYFKG